MHSKDWNYQAKFSLFFSAVGQNFYWRWERRRGSWRRRTTKLTFSDKLYLENYDLHLSSNPPQNWQYDLKLYQEIIIIDSKVFKAVVYLFLTTVLLTLSSQSPSSAFCLQEATGSASQMVLNKIQNQSHNNAIEIFWNKQYMYVCMQCKIYVME